MNDWISKSYPYMDSLGYMTLNPEAKDGPGAGNLLLHTGLFYVAKYRAGLLNSDDKKRFANTCEISAVDGFPGLFWRSVYKKGDRQEHDDYIALCSADYFCGTGIAEAIVAHGAKHNWCYNSQEPKIYDPTLVHDRFPGQVNSYKMCVGEKLSVWDYLLVAGRALALAFSKNDDSHIHSYLFTAVGLEEAPLVFYPVYWLKKMTGKNFAGYLGAQHPMVDIER